ncbi:aminoglycoside phosphotransferase family protein [Alkalimarinus alittae]|uniref:Phosphotransferase n=1 Tax=Alkalimarinus alittae TaxID=2961619 RepID=A0ABY6N3L2_9ALTE|nr:phosphotransferase [Alkalimarinus alittae]UZE96676.1 phosphotransferase [Alkalimarinus alittae]
MDLRLQQLHKWLEQQFKGDTFTIAPVSGDASFRRYFRVEQQQKGAPSLTHQWIAMDAPPEKEDSRPFVAIARHWESLAIQVPHIKAFDLAQGFMLLSDFGNTLLLDTTITAPNKTESLYRSALNTLTHIQSCSSPEDHALPPYDSTLLAREMELFREWLVSKKLGIELSPEDHDQLNKSFQFLIDEALAQPIVCVHRDYHSRNLMALSDGSIGVIDFQDAVMGPITYDAVSLLRDCYIVLPASFIEQQLQAFHQATLDAGLHNADYSQFQRWFDLMGVQRHLKAAGIFARLSLRDGKHDYLNDIPRTVNYIERVSSNYTQLNDFNHWLKAVVIPAINHQLPPPATHSQPEAAASQGL